MLTVQALQVGRCCRLDHGTSAMTMKFDDILACHAVGSREDQHQGAVEQLAFFIAQGSHCGMSRRRQTSRQGGSRRDRVRAADPDDGDPGRRTPAGDGGDRIVLDQDASSLRVPAASNSLRQMPMPVSPIGAHPRTSASIVSGTTLCTPR